MDDRLRSRLRSLGTILIIGAAIVSITARVLVARIDQQRSAIEAWLTHLVGTPVTIGALQVRWNAGLPFITADDIQIRNGQQTVVHVAHAHATLSLLQSIKKRHVALDTVAINQLSFTLLRGDNGQFEIAGIPGEHTNFIEWLFKQPTFIITNADITLQDAHDAFKPLLAHSVELSFNHVGEGAHLRGHAAEVEQLGQRIDFQLVLPTRTLNAAGNELRIASANLNVLELIQIMNWQALPFKSAVGNLKLWFTSQNNGWRVALHGDDLEVTLADHAQPLKPFAVDGVARVAGDVIEANLNSTLLDPNHPQAWRLELQRGETPTVFATTDALSLKELQPLVPTFKVRALKGELHEVKLGIRNVTGDHLMYASGGLHQLSIAATDTEPSFAGNTARVALNGNGGAVALNDTDIVLNHAQRLTAPITLDAANGVVSWTRTANDLAVSWNLSALLNALPLSAVGNFAKAQAETPTLALDATLGTGEIAAIPTLIPTGILHPHGDAWLRGAFLDGLLTSAHIHAAGSLDELMRTDSPRAASLELATENVTLRYDPNWPTITGVNSTVKIEGTKISGTATAAKFFDSPLKSATFEIADAMTPQPILSVNGTVRASLADIVHTLRESPLHGPTYATLSALEMTDNIDLDLNLLLTLHHGGSESASGAVHFDGNTLSSTNRDIQLDKLVGKLTFDRDHWEGRDVQGEFQGQSVRLDAHGGHRDSQSFSEFTMRGTSTADQIGEALAHFAPSLHNWMSSNHALNAMQGKASWRATLNLPGDDEHSAQTVVESDLTGLALNFPTPLNKKAEESRGLRIETKISSRSPRGTRISFGDQIHVALQNTLQTDGTPALSRAELLFGADSNLSLAHEGIYIGGSLHELPSNAWIALFKQGSPLGTTLPVAFDFTLKTIQLLGQRISQLNLSGKREAAGWGVHLQSAPLAGDMTLPLDLAQSPITLNLQRCWLEPIANTASAKPLDPRDFPAMKIEAQSFKYNALDLGHASITVSRIDAGLRLDSLEFKNDAFATTAQGDWTNDTSAQRSQFSIRVTGDAFSPILERFGYTANAMSGGKTSLDIDAGWDGMPSEFALSKIDGKLHMLVKKGRLLDIEPGSGRLFGLLSLQTLPRRLALDFADIFKKGFAFDRIEGEFELDHGNAYTNQLSMEGPSAKIELSGRAGLSQQDYDQRATVTPTLSKSIPLAGAFFGPAGIGVGAAIYLGEQVFKDLPDQLDRFLQKKYSITGSWDNPIVTPM